MPERLTVFRFADWHDPAWDADYEPGGYFQQYLARQEWQDARRRWLAGDDPEPQPESPRLVQRGSVYTAPIPEKPPEGVTPQVNRAAGERRARPIRLR